MGGGSNGSPGRVNNGMVRTACCIWQSFCNIICVIAQFCHINTTGPAAGRVVVQHSAVSEFEFKCSKFESYLQAQQAQGPADLRSVTVTSVHALALEHPAILRAHFGICGRIVRATVLRDQTTGMSLDVSCRLYIDAGSCAPS